MTSKSGCICFLVFCCLFPNISGQCPNSPTPMADFDMEQFKGEWYLQAYTPSAPALVVEPEFRCNIQTFYPTDDPAVFNISNQFIRSNGSEWKGENQAVIHDLSQPALWTLGADGFEFTVMAFKTDYVSWSFLYACGVFNEFPVAFSMIHSREKEMDEELREYVNDLVAQQGFPPEFQININQTDCVFSTPWSESDLI